MFSKKALIAVVALGLGASSANADGPLPTLPLPLYGSDTLFNVTRDIIAACSATNPNIHLSYKGTGSGQGGKAMGPGDSAANPAIPAHNQQIAPQSRFLSTAECSAAPFATNAGNGIVIGLDGIAVIANAPATPNGCDTLRSTDNGQPALTGYTFSDWRDVLRLLYTGQSSHVSFDPCSPNDPPATPGSAPGNIIGRCDSQARKDLIANWGAMFEGGCSNATCPTGLRHAFRRDDVSGTTDTFLTLLGLPKATTRTFCNGQDNEDLDPIRTACNANEQVCANIPYAARNFNPEGAAPTLVATEPAGTYTADLGVVLAVTMPTDTTKQYPALCPGALGGAFRLAPMPFAASLQAQRCPDGNPRSNGQCRWPAASSTGNFCLARIANRPGSRVFTNFDARAYNLIPRDPVTGVILLPNAAGLNDPRWGGGGWYRLHQTTAMANGTGTCTKQDATDQLGCLTIADPCTISYAGREGVVAGNKALNLDTPVRGSGPVGPSVASINLLLDPAGGPTCANGASNNYGLRYPLARKLYINASKGMAAVTNDVTASDATTITTGELDFITCVKDRANGVTDGAISANKFIPLPSNLTDFPPKACSTCGNGVLEGAEVCDPPVAGSGGCNATCTGFNP